MKRLANLTSLVAIMLIASNAMAAKWSLSTKDSSINFITVKKDTVPEIQEFGRLDASIQNYQAKLVVDTSSIDTSIDIRDQRIQDWVLNPRLFLAALYASIHNRGHLMPWITDGFRPYSGSLLAQTNLNGNGADKFQRLVEPNNQSYNGTSRYVAQDNLDLIRSFRQERISQRASDKGQLLRQREQYRRFLDATTQNEGLGRFVELMNMADYGAHNTNHGANKNVVRSLAAFAAGISLSADIRVSNFDTHGNHDVAQANKLSELNNAVDLLWDVADQFGIADRLVVNIVSDFGRTNRYNDKGGKDHWSTTSSIIMENNPSWGNRVVGASDDGHHAQKVDFMSLKPSGSVNDITLSPNHVQSALRKYLRIDQEATSARFGLEQNNLAAPLFYV